MLSERIITTVIFINKAYFTNSKNAYLIQGKLYFITQLERNLVQCDLQQICLDPKYLIQKKAVVLANNVEHFSFDNLGMIWSTTEDGTVEKVGAKLSKKKLNQKAK